MESTTKLKDTVVSMVPAAEQLSVQISSDIHLEMYSHWKHISARLPWEEHYDTKQPPLLVKAAPNLALLGDIGCPATHMEWYERFVASVAGVYEHVFLLAGNHEYYVSRVRLGEVPATVSALHTAMREVADRYDNVHFLCPDVVVLGDVRVIGATLWSQVTEVREVQRALNDYHRSWIALSPPKTPPATDKKHLTVRSLRVKDTVAWHNSEVNWIQTQLKLAAKLKQRALVLTHHAPAMTGTSNAKYEGNIIQSAFATDLTHLFPLVHTWCFGHTHYNVDANVKGMHLAANQAGYKFEPASGYRPDFVVHV